MWWTDPRHGLEKEKFAVLEMNGKPAPFYRSWFKHLERVRIALRIDSRSCYINPSSPPPPALFGFPPSSALFPLLAVGNHIHPCMENFLRGWRRAARRYSAPGGYARYDRRTGAVGVRSVWIFLRKTLKQVVVILQYVSSGRVERFM